MPNIRIYSLYRGRCPFKLEIVFEHSSLSVDFIRDCEYNIYQFIVFNVFAKIKGGKYIKQVLAKHQQGGDNIDEEKEQNRKKRKTQGASPLEVSDRMESDIGVEL